MMRNALFVSTSVSVGLLLAGCAVQPPRPPAPMLQAGEPVDCLQTTRIRSTSVQDDRTIDFHMRNGAIYRNNLPHSCPGLGIERAFSYQLSIPQLCKVDMVTVLRTGGGSMRGATCGLGVFVPVKADPSRGKASPARP